MQSPDSHGAPSPLRSPRRLISRLCLLLAAGQLVSALYFGAQLHTGKHLPEPTERGLRTAISWVVFHLLGTLLLRAVLLRRQSDAQQPTRRALSLLCVPLGISGMAWGLLILQESVASLPNLNVGLGLAGALTGLVLPPVAMVLLYRARHRDAAAAPGSLLALWTWIWAAVFALGAFLSGLSG